MFYCINVVDEGISCIFHENIMGHRLYSDSILYHVATSCLDFITFTVQLYFYLEMMWWSSQLVKYFVIADNLHV
jgi:hypothetical protein